MLKSLRPMYRSKIGMCAPCNGRTFIILHRAETWNISGTGCRLLCHIYDEASARSLPMCSNGWWRVALEHPPEPDAYLVADKIWTHKGGEPLCYWQRYEKSTLLSNSHNTHPI